MLHIITQTIILINYLSSFSIKDIFSANASFLITGISLIIYASHDIYVLKKDDDLRFLKLSIYIFLIVLGVIDICSIFFD